jgi:hypothetical protein
MERRMLYIPILHIDANLINAGRSSPHAAEQDPRTNIRGMLRHGA